MQTGSDKMVNDRTAMRPLIHGTYLSSDVSNGSWCHVGHAMDSSVS
jgi:hypothetical protein